MIALRYLEMDVVNDFLDTFESVGKVERRLEEATEKKIEEHDKSKRVSYALANQIVLDRRLK